MLLICKQTRKSIYILKKHAAMFVQFYCKFIILKIRIYIKTGGIILLGMSPSNFDSLVSTHVRSHLHGVTRLLRNGKRRSEGAETLACTRRIYPNEEKRRERRMERDEGDEGREQP